MFVFNTGNKTVSIIDAESDELVRTVHLGATSSFPSNQYSPRLVDSSRRTLWLNVDGGVLGVDAESLEEVARVETGAAANWVNLSPDGEHVAVSAREPAHEQLRIDADPDSERFGTVTGRIRRAEGYDGPRDGPGPCDVSFGPDGRYAYVPDIFGDTVSVVAMDRFEVVAQVDVDPALDGADAASPYMGTVSWDGRYWVVENDEGEHGTVSIWDVSSPTEPAELARLTESDGLGESPLTDEIGPDSETAYVFTPGTEDVTVIDLRSREVVERIPVGGRAFVGTWGPDREKLYVPVQTSDAVKVIDHSEQAVVETVSVGPKPYGATAGAVRPRPTTTGRLQSAIASLGLLDGESTYCIGSCHCGMDTD